MTDTEHRPLDPEYEWYVTDHGHFRINKSKWGTFVSIDSEGTNMVTAGTKDACLHVTPNHMRWRVEGYDGPETVTHEGTVDGKL